MLVTLCTIRQLPQAFLLGDSFVRYAADGQSASVLIGLVDDPAHLPPNVASPYPLLPVGEWLPAGQLASLSAAYTPTEFAAACKPLFMTEIFRRYPDVDTLLYADPNIRFFSALTPVWERLTNASALLTPHITRPPVDDEEPGPGRRGVAWPDEKFFQNVGLYSADFLAFRRSAETDRLLTWWRDRVTERAYVDFCAGLCLDQLWLMHVPVFFPGTAVVKQAGWHVGLWNLPERTLRQDGADWLVTGPSGQTEPVLFANFKGLYNFDEGFFVHQTRLRLVERPYVVALLNEYRRALARHQTPTPAPVRPAYGQRPEPPVLRGWRRATVDGLRAITRFVDWLPLPVIR